MQQRVERDRPKSLALFSKMLMMEEPLPWPKKRKKKDRKNARESESRREEALVDLSIFILTDICL